MGIFSRKTHTETFYASAMSNVEIIEEDLLYDTKVRLALKRMQNANYSARDYALDFGNTGAAQFFQYHMVGKDEFIDGLPVVTVGGGGIPISSAQEALNAYFGKEVIILDFDVVTEIATKYVISGQTNISVGDCPDVFRAILCHYYDYDYATDILYYGGLTYKPATNRTNTIFTNSINLAYNYGINPAAVLLNCRFYRTDMSAYLDLTFNTSLPVSEYLNKVPVEETTNYVGSNGIGSPITTTWNKDIVTIGPFVKVVYIDPNTGRTQIIMHTINPTMPYWGTRFEELTLDATATSLATVAKERTIDKYEPYPIATLRNSGINILDYANMTGDPLERYKSTKTLLESIGMPLDTLTEAYSDPDSMSSGSLADLRDVHFVMGVSPGNTESSIVSKVLYQHFEKLYSDFPPFKPVKGIDAYSTYLIETRERYFTNYLTWTPADTVVINDNDPLGTYSHTISTDVAEWNPGGIVIGSPYLSSVGILGYTVAYDAFNVLYPTDFVYQVLINGAFYQVDTVTNFVTVDNTSYFIIESSKNRLINLVNAQVASEGGIVGERYSVTYSNILLQGAFFSDKMTHNLVLKHQFSETQARVITLKNFRSITNALERQIVNELLNEDTSLNKNLIVLFHESEVSNLSFMERTDLMSHSLHLNFFAQASKTVTWKSGGFFNVFIKVIAVVITIIICIVAPPAGAGMAASFGTAAAAAATATALTAFTNLLMGLVISVALKIIMQHLNIGGWLGAIISFVISVVVTYYTGGYADFGQSLVASTLKVASQLTELASKIMEAISLESLKETSEGFNKLQEQISNFFSQYTTVNEKYDDILKSLNTSIGPEFLVSLQRMGGYGSGGSGYTGSEYANGWILSPSSIYETSMTAQYAYDTLYTNDVETYCDRSLTIGLV